MSSNSATVNLDERIVMLEAKQSAEWADLKEQFQMTKESFRPINLIKETFHDFTSSPDIKHNVVNSVVGLASGYLTRKVLMGSSHNPIKKIAGAILQFAVTNLVGRKMKRAEEGAAEEEIEVTTPRISSSGYQ